MRVKLFSLSFLNGTISIVNVLTAVYLLGVSSVKDEIDLFTALSKSLVTSFGLGALGGSTLYIVASKINLRNAVRNTEVLFIVTFSIQLFFGCMLIFLSWNVPPSLLIEVDALAFLENIKSELAFFYIAYIIIQPATDLVTGFLLGTRGFSTVLWIQITQKIFNLIGLVAASIFGLFWFCGFFVAGIVLTCSYGFYKLNLKLRFRDVFFYKKVSSDLARLVKISLPFIILGPFGGVGILLLYPQVVENSPGDLAAFTYAQSAVSIFLASLAFPVAEPFIQRFSVIWSDENQDVEVTRMEGHDLVMQQGVQQLSLLLGYSFLIVLIILTFGDFIADWLGGKLGSVYAGVKVPLILLLLSMPAQHLALVVNRLMVVLERPWMSAILPAGSSFLAAILVTTVFRLQPTIDSLVSFSLLGSVLSAVLSSVTLSYIVGIGRKSYYFAFILILVLCLPFVGLFFISVTS